MASLLMTILGSLFGCQSSSKEVALMIAEPQGEGVTSSLSGIDYKVEGTNIGIGNHRLEVFPYVEQCGVNASDHICGIRFEISTEGKRQPALTYGVVGKRKSKEAALKDAVHSWWAGFTVPLIASLAEKTPDYRESTVLVYHGAMSIRGTPPGGWLDGSEEVHRKILPALKPVVRDRPATKVISLRLIISPEGVKDMGSRIDGRLSRELVEAVSTLPWPKTDTMYIFYQTYVLRNKDES